MKKILLIIVVIIVAMLIPATALAADYTINSGAEYDISALSVNAKETIFINTTDPVTLTGTAPLGGVTINCSPGTNLTIRDLNNVFTTSGGHHNGIIFDGTANFLTLEGTNIITSEGNAATIRVQGTTELTIDGTGIYTR